jgi:lipopolysaccharide export LptBFGC system permease protein LptF
VLAAAIIKARLHGTTTYKTVIFILAALRTSNLTKSMLSLILQNVYNRVWWAWTWNVAM